jgi:hypothetical protein
MPSRLTHRLLVPLALVCGIAAACSDAALDPVPPLTLQGPSPSDSGARPNAPTPDPAPTPTRPDSARPDSTLAGPGTLWGATVENFVLQWRDAAGVTRDSAGYRGIAGVTVTVHATTRPDSTSGVPAQERQVGTLTTDATGQFRTAALPDGWYTLRARWTTPGAVRTATASAELIRGHQRPTIAFLNLR